MLTLPPVPAEEAAPFDEAFWVTPRIIVAAFGTVIGCPSRDESPAVSGAPAIDSELHNMYKSV